MKYVLISSEYDTDVKIYYDKLKNKFNFNIREITLNEKEVKRVIKEGITDITKYKEYSIILNSLEELNQLEKEIEILFIETLLESVQENINRSDVYARY